MSTQLLFPILYIGGLAGIFSAFVKWNQKRQSAELKNFEQNSYFGPNEAKQIYLELTEQYSAEDAFGKKVLSMALVRRALAAVERIMSIRDEKPALNNLVKQGSVGEDLWNKIQLEEKALDDEVSEIVEEAEFYRPGWKETLFQEATQLYQKQVQMNLQKEKAESEQVESKEINKNQEQVKKETEEEQRKRLEEELILEEEKERKKKTNLKKRGNAQNKK